MAEWGRRVVIWLATYPYAIGSDVFPVPFVRDQPTPVILHYESRTVQHSIC